MMNGEISIRLANKDDALALVNFNQAMALETEGKTLDAQILSSGVESVFHDEKKGFYVVAEDNSQIVGGLMVTFEWSDWRDNWFWWIQSVYILPEYRGRRIYSLLYEFVKNEAKNQGDVCGFRLYVEHDNFKAQQVYEKLGMQKSHYLMYEEMV
jgi:ribosomal protein S18 acetylase RimI-like enzyme